MELGLESTGSRSPPIPFWDARSFMAAALAWGKLIPVEIYSFSLVLKTSSFAKSKSARALRAAVTSEGFDLPVGMCWDEDAVLFGYNPAQDITVYNNHTYPVKINMWTEGDGTGMGIYGQIVRYVPN